MNGNEIAEALKDVVKPGETILCTDGHSAFLHLGNGLGILVGTMVSAPIGTKRHSGANADFYAK